MVSRLENEAVLDRMQARLAQRPEVLDRRRETVEHPFGTIKQWMNQGAFLMRGLEKVRAEFSLTALAYNLRRVLNIVGFTELMAALTAWQARGWRFAAPLKRLPWRATLPTRRFRTSDISIQSAVTTPRSTRAAPSAAKSVFSHGLCDFILE